MKALLFDKEKITCRAFREKAIGVQEESVKRVCLYRFLFGEDIVQVIERLDL